MGEEMKMEEIAEGRSRIYFMLSRVFLKEVSRDFLKSMREKGFVEYLRGLGVDLGEDFVKGDEEDLLEELASEYTQLFIAPAGASPYESVWLKGLLMQEPAAEALAFYKRCGFELPEDFKSFPDQIGVELSFLGHLTAEEAKAWKEGNEKLATEILKLEKEFLKKHLKRWAFKFCECVMAITKLPFYREMARLTKEFLKGEMEDMGIELDRTVA